MLNFELRNVSDLIFGPGSEDRCAGLVREYGGSRVLIHHAGEPFVLGLVKKIREQLEAAGLFCVELAGVVPNPRVSLVNTGAVLCREQNIDFVLAIGGGSVIDSAKLIALAAQNEGDAWAFCNGAETKEMIYPVLPIGVISTFAGTGSEMTVGSVITNEETKEKNGLEYIGLRPKFSILNPELTLTIPPFQTASGVADIASHLLENFFSPIEESDLAGNLIVGGLRTVIKHGSIVAEQPQNLHSRSELMALAPIAIYGILKVGRYGDWACHSLEHAMSGEWDVAHGAGLAIITPVWMRYIYKKHLDLFVRLAVEVFGLAADPAPETTALAGIAALERFFFETLKLPRTLAEMGIGGVTDEDVRRVAHMIFLHGGNAIGGLEPLQEADCREILTACL